MNTKDEIKENDLVTRVWPSGHKTMGVAEVPEFENSGELYWKALETYKYEGGVTKGRYYGIIRRVNKEFENTNLRKATEKEVLMHKLS